MQFVFKRDEKGNERIYVGEARHYVAEVKVSNDGEMWAQQVVDVQGVTYETLNRAIERADEAGFWAKRMPRNPFIAPHFERDEVTFDVPVAETSTTLTLVREDD